ncbi:transmembrane protein 273 isoform 2-T2 [Trichechus inunguis]|uniref:Transmembrane protein 273 isoform X2 n=1 Tax=Trichechus manatus latirostris TaxID=127582 RepID=A0A2Y9RTI4_TRIMA|nr:transmembrane protein 273 isoform X2 [Trichechus manatus latirostris]
MGLTCAPWSHHNQLHSNQTLFSFFADVGKAQVLATGESAVTETDAKYAIIGTALGVAISAGFLALKICMYRKHVFDNDSSDAIVLKKSTLRRNCRSSERDARVIEL